MRAPLTFVGEKNRKVTAVYPANDSQSCTCKLNLGLYLKVFFLIYGRRKPIAVLTDLKPRSN